MRSCPRVVCLVALLAPACGAPTEIVLLIQSDVELAVEGAPEPAVAIDSLFVQVDFGGRSRCAEDRVVGAVECRGSLGAALDPFPSTLVLEPGPPVIDLVSANTSLAEETVAEWAVGPVAFSSGRTDVLELDLTLSCAGVRCPIGCRAGYCVSEVSRFEFDGTLPAFDDCADGASEDIDLANSRQHCGACNSRCPDVCVFGSCQPGRPTEISASASSTCALHGAEGGSSGVVMCWGGNESGELGDVEPGLSAELRPLVRSQPRAVPILTEDGALITFSRLTAGFAHYCALTPNGFVYCWGRNDTRQLGNSDVADPIAGPVDAEAFDIRDIDAGVGHTCAITTDDGADREVVCWGDNRAGQVTGEPGTMVLGAMAAMPVEGEAVLSVAAGAEHSCAVLSDGGEVRCWGSNVFDQHGNDSIAGASEVEAGRNHTCAAFGTQVRCWGLNELRALGVESPAQSAEPIVVPIPALVPARPTDSPKRLSASLGLEGRHTCAITVDGVFCWGGENRAGELGSPGGGPVPLGGAQTRSVAAGNQHACALASDDGRQVVCWGANAAGQRGLWTWGPDATDEDRGRLAVPLPVLSP
jgi:alpha-tubulin suppressor-like RCC1 family protein